MLALLASTAYTKVSPSYRLTRLESSLLLRQDDTESKKKKKKNR